MTLVAFRQRLFGAIYVKVWRDRFSMRHIETGRCLDLSPTNSFSTRRLLIGQFNVAEALLKNGVHKLCKKLLLTPSPQIIMHPLEMVEGGLSQVEDRVLREVAAGAGASWVHVWVGHELSDDEVLEQLTLSKNSFNG